MMSFTPIGCSSGLEKMMDLPPDIARTIPYLPELVVDGEAWDWSPDYVPLKIHSDICGNIPDTNDFQAFFRMAWSEKGIFLLVEIIDDSIYEDPDHFWMGDGIELFLSRRRGSREILQVSVRPGFDLSGSMASFYAYDHLKSVSINVSETSMGFSSKKTSRGYMLEGMVPFELLKMQPRQDMEMATQLYLNDADREDDPNNFSLPWYSVRESYQNPYAFHSILLTDCQHPDVSPELRACVVDNKTVRIKVICDHTQRGQVFQIVSGSFKQRFKDKILKEWNLPVDKTSFAEGSFVGLLLGDQVIDVLDLGMVKHVHEDADPPEWYENEIRLFEILDRYDPPPDSAVLFTGSSTIRRWHNLAEDMYPQRVINRGFGGSVMKELNQNIERIVFPYRPIRIFVYEGDNDIARGTEPLSFLEECKTFINRCQQHLPGTEIIFLSIKPSPARMRHWKKMDRANQMLADFCGKKDNVLFIDISKSMFVRPGILKNDIYAEDGVHLNDKGYALLREAIMEYTINLSN
jgi:lysophospholipase L1-like esterase